MKLPLQEVEQKALLAELAQWDGYVSSALLGVEAIRACERYGQEYAMEARSLIMDVALLPIDDTVLDEAAAIAPAALGSLDALHLATALSICGEIGAFITYDLRLAGAAADRGLAVSMPGSHG